MTLRDDVLATPAAQRPGFKANALRTLFNALPEGERLAFVEAGIQVEVLNGPDVVRNRLNNVVGLRVTARGRDANGLLPPGRDVHRVINPPIMMPDGTTTTVVDPLTGESKEVPNYAEQPLAAFKAWLAESIKVAARAQGWVEA